MARKRIAATRFHELMESGELHSRIIRDVAEIDGMLDAIIASYFTSPGRASSFRELVLSRLATYTKMVVVESLPYRRQPRSLRHIDTLRHLLQARNFFAHTHRLPADAPLPPRVQPWLYLLADYPRSYQLHLRSVRRMLRSLQMTRDIAGT